MEGRGSATAAGRVAVVTMMLVLAMAPGALAATHIVGNSTQKWDFPPSNDETYYDSTWVPSQKFTVGDSLLFEYTAGQHNVVQFATLAEYNACSGTAVKTYTTGNDTVSLPTAGTYYFICSFQTHCGAGMKVSFNVTAATATPPSTTPSPPTTASPPPPSGTGGSAASSGPVLSMAGLLFAAFVATLACLV